MKNRLPNRGQLEAEGLQEGNGALIPNVNLGSELGYVMSVSQICSHAPHCFAGKALTPRVGKEHVCWLAQELFTATVAWT